MSFFSFSGCALFVWWLLVHWIRVLLWNKRIISCACCWTMCCCWRMMYPSAGMNAAAAAAVAAARHPVRHTIPTMHIIKPIIPYHLDNCTTLLMSEKPVPSVGKICLQAERGDRSHQNGSVVICFCWKHEEGLHQYGICLFCQTCSLWFVQQVLSNLVL